MKMHALVKHKFRRLGGCRLFLNLCHDYHEYHQLLLLSQRHASFVLTAMADLNLAVVLHLIAFQSALRVHFLFAFVCLSRQRSASTRLFTEYS